MSNEPCHHGSSKKNPLYTVAGVLFAVLGGYYLWAQHRAHVFQYLPFAFFLLCPLMHFFGGHGGHGGRGGHDHSEDNSKGDSK